MTSITRIKESRPDPLPETLEKLADEIQAQIARFHAEGNEEGSPAASGMMDDR